MLLSASFFENDVKLFFKVEVENKKCDGHYLEGAQIFRSEWAHWKTLWALWNHNRTGWTFGVLSVLHSAACVFAQELVRPHVRSPWKEKALPLQRIEKAFRSHCKCKKYIICGERLKTKNSLRKYLNLPPSVEIMPSIQQRSKRWISLLPRNKRKS